jgi:hypothetical protein
MLMGNAAVQILLLLTLSCCRAKMAAVTDVVDVGTQDAATASDVRSAVVHVEAREMLLRVTQKSSTVAVSEVKIAAVYACSVAVDKTQMLMMLSLWLHTDTAAVKSAEALEQVKAADVDVARQS